MSIVSNLKHLFKANENREKVSGSLEMLFDFAVLAMVSLIFNGFIINSHRAPNDQIFFMCFAAGLVATHWYSYTFFRQRYEKKGMFFRIWTFFKVASLAVAAVGIDLMVFRLNGEAASQDFLRTFAPLLFIGAFAFTRILNCIEFALAAFFNRSNRALVQLTIYKSLSRLLVVALALIHFSLLFTHHEWVDELTYIFMPIYLVIEFIGNFAAVTRNNLNNSPAISFKYAKERFTKLNILYIASIFVSGTIQFAFYFHTESDLYMLPRLLMTYTIAFLLWWLYSDRVYRLNLKISVSSIIFFSTFTTIITMLFAVFGGMLINANNDLNIQYIIPAGFITLAIILLLYNLMLKFLIHDKMTSKYKWELLYGSIPASILLFTLGIVSIFVDMNMWVFYGVTITTLLTLNTHSRIVINRSEKK